MKVNRDKGSADGGLSKADEPIKDGLQGLTVPTEDRLPWAGTSEQGTSATPGRGERETDGAVISLSDPFGTPVIAKPSVRAACQRQRQGEGTLCGDGTDASRSGSSEDGQSSSDRI